MATAHHGFAWIHPFGNCNDCDQYYQMLARADLGHDAALEGWCIYVLQGILDELRKVDRLADYGYLQEKILIPALAVSRERGLITADEHTVLLTVMKLKTAKSADLAPGMPALGDAQRTYQLRKQVDRKMLQPIHEGARQYSLSFTSSYLLRGVVKALGEQGFIPASLN